MHELSIAETVVDTVLDRTGGKHVTVVRLRIDRDVLDALSHYRSARGLTSWDAAVTGLLGQEAIW